MTYQPPHLRSNAQQNVRPASSSSRGGGVSSGYTIQQSGRGSVNGPRDRPPFKSRPASSQGSTLQSPAGDLRPARRLQELKLDPMELVQSVSRSGGDGAEGDALKDFEMQERFRIYIDERIDKHYVTFKTARHTAPGHGQQDEVESLSSIVLLFRKLREGVVASSRIDDFAIEVFESSARMSILAKHTSQLTSSLSGLVPGLYHAVDDKKGKRRATAVDDLADTFSDLTVITNGGDNRAGFASILLLLQLVQSESTSNFHSTLLQLTSPPSTRLHPKFYSLGTTRQDRPLLSISSLSYAIQASCALSIERFDPIKYFKLVNDDNISSYERIVLGWAEGKVRDRAWEVMKRGYITTRLEWACRWVGEEGDEWVGKRGGTCIDGIVKLR